MAVGVLQQPLVTAAALALALGACALGIGRESRLPQLFLVGLGGALAGYAFFGKGFAYLGVFPVFVGELCLALGIAALLVGGGLGVALRSPISWVLAAFMVHGALRTAPYWSSEGVDALRDGVLWGYGAFALLVSAALSRPGWFERALGAYASVLPWFLLWTAPALLVFEMFPGEIPKLPGSGVPVLHVKPGDFGVHLAGGAAFLGLGLHGLVRARRLPRATEWLLWLAGLAGFVAVGSQSRSAMLAVLVALGVVAVKARLGRLLQIVAVAAVVGGVLFTLGLEMNVGSRGRKVSPQQVVANLGSIVGSAARPGLETTREWRKNWWRDIVEYTVLGEYFWSGKGYGINLATEDGYVVDQDRTLRSPHNGTLTVLARSGVPGLTLWVLLHACFGVAMLRAYARANRAGFETWARIDLWILAYWSAFLVNSSFDVFLEGPQGGIWFWSLVGFGLAALRLQHEELARATAWPSWRPGGAST